MNGSNRRIKILELLKNKQKAVSGSELSKILAVSRQVIVSDIALLRASGEAILSTPKGYVIDDRENENYIYKTIACKHKKNLIEEELNLIVDEGATVVNVIVEHSVYGQITGDLHLSSRRDIREFMKKLDKDTTPLSQLTDGIHLHTIKCKDTETLENVINVLREGGYTL
ncbi:transcription repressor NadR [Paraclostridium bifermentans]|uniref:transcription repressor NadR n=1 Tax=Paraclostridium bifermentans TaxID=1490 RepID=UPI00359C2003